VCFKTCFDTNTLDELGAKEETVEAKIYMS
nr:hypothetical protein [Tanacetum cinerariifolium]